MGHAEQAMHTSVGAVRLFERGTALLSDLDRQGGDSVQNEDRLLPALTQSLAEPPLALGKCHFSHFLFTRYPLKNLLYDD